MKIVRPYIYIFLLVATDQLSKYFVLKYLKNLPGYFLEATSFLSIVLAWNHGISFGWFGDYYQYSNRAFIFINSGIILYLFRILSQSYYPLTRISYILIIGGAIGNLYCRIAKGAVFDFLYFHLGNYGFPAFNFADAFIFVGVCFLILSIYLNPQNSKS